ncbi:MAG: DUF937 domain-containing protein [Xanthomonadales bacterium]|nr:DUF937 domain-containing protein [Xanthomonadales bacterium]
MVDLTQEVLSRLDASSIAGMAAELGIAPTEAESAVRQAVPMVIGGLARNATSEDGATALHRAVGDHAGLDLGAVIGSVLGGGGGGGSILGHVFGSRREQAAEGLGQASGIGTKNAAQLLAMLAPIIMAVLGKRTREQGLGSGGLGGMLGDELRNLGRGAQGGLLASILDRDGDGELGLGDLLKAGADLLGPRARP